MSMSRTVAGVTTGTSYCYDGADRLLSSTDGRVSAPSYDAHGNTIFLGIGADRTEYRYDSSDRNVAVIQNGGATETFTSRDAQGRITYRQEDSYGASAKQTFSGYSGPGDSPDFLRRSDWTVIEKYLPLPGGVLLTVRPLQAGTAGKAYSLPNVHGDVMATVDGTGTLTAAFKYDPFGVLLSSARPDNSAAGTGYGWEGSSQRMQEVDYTQAPIQMGARVYVPLLGRFLSVDPVQGGTANNYVYSLNPLIEKDLSGTFIPIVIAAVLNGIIIAVTAYDAYQFYKSPTIINGLWLGLDLVPGGAEYGVGRDALKAVHGVEALRSGNRFFKGAVIGAVGFKYEIIGGKFIKFSYEVPASTVGPPARAIYVKVITLEGKTLSVYKDTYNKFNHLLHRKFK